MCHVSMYRICAKSKQTHDLYERSVRERKQVSLIYVLATIPHISTVTHPATLLWEGNQNRFRLTRPESFPLDNCNKHLATMT